MSRTARPSALRHSAELPAPRLTHRWLRACFFTSLLPQFVSAGHPVLLPFLILGAIFVAMVAVWLVAYTLIAARQSSNRTRGLPSVPNGSMTV